MSSRGHIPRSKVCNGEDSRPFRDHCRLAKLEGVEYVGTREEAAGRFELPPERLGDLVVVSGRHTVLGKAPDAHDMSLLEGGLRSHGGLAEQEVPFVLNAPLNEDYRSRAKQGLRNFDLFDFALNGVI